MNSGQTELRLRQGNYLINSTLRIDWGRKVRLVGGYSGVGTNRDYTLYPTNLNGQKKTQIMYIQEDDCSIDVLISLMDLLQALMKAERDLY
ncbi:hypothetical protein [Soonwooa sp.]|uniref:hypothetical protein n=1 Tax=Soonwooa sp. TaxID=1938592 RepID=UPI00289E9A24|nr:hypothetical protein [Soonwooa sp.]